MVTPALAVTLLNDPAISAPPPEVEFADRLESADITIYAACECIPLVVPDDTPYEEC